MSELKDFEIDENGNLSKYHGNDSTVVIPDGVKSIDYNVFRYSDTLKEISIPDSIEKIDCLNFDECNNLTYNEINGVRYLGNSKNPYLVLMSADEDTAELSVINGCKIIFGNALADNTNLKRVFIPSSVKNIGFMAFYDCTSLSEIEISEGVSEIEENAFENHAAERIVLPDSITKIGYCAFSSVNLKEVILPNGINYIGNCAFTENEIKFNEYNGAYYIGSSKNPYLCFVKPCDRNLTSLTIHDGTRIIYSSAFMGCGEIKSVILPRGLVQIGSDAFRECGKLKNITLPDSLRAIDECAFANCDSLTEIIFPKSEINIGAAAFMSCASLLSIDINRASVGDNAFDGCESLKSIKIGEKSNLYGDYIFAGCSAVSEVRLPKSLEKRFTEDEFEDSETVTITYV